VGKTYCTTVTITTCRMLSKQEIENEIIRLLQEGKTYREISKILHVSPTQISAVRKKYEGSTNEPGIQTKAYKMFHSSGKLFFDSISQQIFSSNSNRPNRRT
jgi:uncharacterized protein YerC